MKKRYSFERVRDNFNYPTPSKWRRSGGDRRVHDKGYAAKAEETDPAGENDRRARRDRRTSWLDVISRVLYPRASEDIRFSAWH